MTAMDASVVQQGPQDGVKLHAHPWREARRSIYLGLAVLAVSAAGFGLFVASMPPLQEAELDTLMRNFPPKNLQSVRVLRDTLLNYATTYPKTVAVALLLLYVLMQTFAIPGTISLSLLSGALYGSSRGFMLIAAISTLGASSCYSLSWLIGRPIAAAVWKARLDDFQQQVAKRRHDLLSYIIFLRVTPILPNTFINVASPIVGVPLLQFFLGTLIGCAPNNFMAANAGDHLSDLDSLSDLYNTRMVLLGLLVGAVALLPVLVKHWHEARQRGQQPQGPRAQQEAAPADGRGVAPPAAAAAAGSAPGAKPKEQ